MSCATSCMSSRTVFHPCPHFARHAQTIRSQQTTNRHRIYDVSKYVLVLRAFRQLVTACAVNIPQATHRTSTHTRKELTSATSCMSNCDMTLLRSSFYSPHKIYSYAQPCLHILRVHPPSSVAESSSIHWHFQGPFSQSKDHLTNPRNIQPVQGTFTC
jgi:hypothetical protein